MRPRHTFALSTLLSVADNGVGRDLTAAIASVASASAPLRTTPPLESSKFKLSRLSTGRLLYTVSRSRHPLESFKSYKGRPFLYKNLDHYLGTRSLAATFSTVAPPASNSASSSAEMAQVIDQSIPKSNAWVGSSGAGGYDLRSDTMTTPTSSMLAAIQSCSLLDDVFNEDPTTIDLEAHCAALTGKEAGLFVLSGTMGNQLALRSLLTQPPHGVLCDYRSHIVKYEAGGVSSLTGATLKPVVPKNGIYLTLEDVKANAYLDDDVHTCPTRVISLENTLNGMIMPLEEVKRISAFAHEHDIKLHCDGARLWEAVASGAGSLAEFASYFDTVSLCFSKGLGAPIGSILVGTKALIKHARWVRKSIGGGLRQPGLVTAPARVAIDETFGKGPNGEGGLLRGTHVLAKEVAKIWTDLGGKLEYPVHTNMVWLDLNDAKCPGARIEELGKEVGLRFMENRLVIHFQILENRHFVVPRLEAIFKTILEEKTKNGAAFEGAKGETSMYGTE
ncbi:pyridoxal phosphate-dependent transferase [Lasiosphaeris hirsuta]|uniref:Pyridoxal phosphate-dependent transferase n=1 Tax=Lasiosphaeris hirsuta TaxID=260670 RepID=A0AA40BC19_9PEZI|nr:pyridoxal phosphate-dependent transferase [Lasiosphaeris hirsuta]